MTRRITCLVALLALLAALPTLSRSETPPASAGDTVSSTAAGNSRSFTEEDSRRAEARVREGAAAHPEGLPPDVLYKNYCGACHGLDLVQSQSLDRGTWEWVLDDMRKLYGATWIRPQEQEVLLDYLAERHGPRIGTDLLK